MAELTIPTLQSPPEAPRANAPATTAGTVPEGAEGTLAPAAEAAAEERISPKLQTIYRREKAALERERAAKAEEARVSAALQGLAEREARLKEFETLKSTNPLKALELLGLTYQDLTNIALSDGNVTPDIQVRKVEEKFDSYLKQQEQKALADAETERVAAERREAQATEEFKSEIGAYLETNVQKYQLIQFEGQHDLVYDVINEHYGRTINPKTGLGKIMSISEAADKVEAYLEKKYDNALNLDKIKTKLTPAEPKPPVKPQPPSHKPTTTLSNNMSATPQRPRSTLLTDDERVAKAIAYARGLRP